MSRLVYAAALLAASAVATRAQAQPEGGRGIGGMVSRAMLLRQDAVQTELGITADQKAKFRAEVGERLRDAAAVAGGFRDLSPEERQQRMEERRAQMAEEDGKIAGILTDAQKARLEQIRVQALGAGVLMDPKISEELGITDDQREELRSLWQEMRDQGRASGDDAGSRREAMMAKVMGILTADQKSKLEALRGPAFDVSSLQLRGRRRAAAN
ncbi:MAG: hypothetical protein RLZZ440_2196 [Planctomycetota bacterium]|jgi:hypothetical protein